MDRVAAYLRNTADILFVIGYCVIAFLKLSFLGILRYEIKEMIQKIKLLQTEMAAAILNPDAEQPQHLQQVGTFVSIYAALFTMMRYFIVLHLNSIFILFVWIKLEKKR